MKHCVRTSANSRTPTIFSDVFFCPLFVVAVAVAVATFCMESRAHICNEFIICTNGKAKANRTGKNASAWSAQTQSHACSVPLSRDRLPALAATAHKTRIVLRAQATVACQSQKIENVQKKSHSLPTHHAMHASKPRTCSAQKKNWMDSSSMFAEARSSQRRSAGATAHDLVSDDRKTKTDLVCFVFISAMATWSEMKARKGTLIAFCHFWTEKKELILAAGGWLTACSARHSCIHAICHCQTLGAPWSESFQRLFSVLRSFFSLWCFVLVSVFTANHQHFVSFRAIQIEFFHTLPGNTRI